MKGLFFILLASVSLLAACQTVVVEKEYVCENGSTVKNPKNCPKLEYPTGPPEGKSCGSLSGNAVGYFPVGKHTECIFACLNGKLHYQDCRFRNKN